MKNNKLYKVVVDICRGGNEVEIFKGEGSIIDEIKKMNDEDLDYFMRWKGGIRREMSEIEEVVKDKDCVVLEGEEKFIVIGSNYEKVMCGVGMIVGEDVWDIEVNDWWEKEFSLVGMMEGFVE